MNSQGEEYDKIVEMLQHARELLAQAERPDGTYSMGLIAAATRVTDNAEMQFNPIGGSDARVRRPASDN